jgi:N-acetylneuraminic acid mutarotase
VAGRKPQAASRKPQAASRKPQVASRKLQVASPKAATSALAPAFVTYALLSPLDSTSVLLMVTTIKRAGPACVIAAIFLAVATNAMRAQPTAGKWTREPDMATPRAAHAVVATADAIYALAGTGPDGKPVSDVERFDGKSWRRETALPGEGLNAPAAAAIGDTIYLIGGFGTTTNRPVTTVHRYNTRTRSWSAAAPLPAPRGGHAAIVMNGRIHVIGGGNSMSTIDDHSVYDPAANQWTERARLPRSMGSPATAVLGGKLYSIGGRSGPNDFGDVHIYEPAKDAWTPGVTIPARGTGGAAVSGGSIYYFGGESQARKVVLGDVLRLDPGAAAWVADQAMPTARNFARVALLKGRVYVVGGSTEYGSSHASIGSGVVESFRP